jgi:hypothetical protein
MLIKTMIYLQDMKILHHLHHKCIFSLQICIVSAGQSLCEEDHPLILCNIFVKMTSGVGFALFSLKYKFLMSGILKFCDFGAKAKFQSPSTTLS